MWFLLPFPLKFGQNHEIVSEFLGKLPLRNSNIVKRIRKKSIHKMQLHENRTK
jgi:hypothetical protein